MPGLNKRSLISLVRGRKFKPFYFYKGIIGAKRIERYFLDLVERSPNLTPFYSDGARGRLEGLASWSRSDWDTRNTGFNTARINFILVKKGLHDTLERIYKAIDDELIGQGFEYLLCRVNTSDLPLIRVLQDNGHHVVDGLMSQALLLSDAPKSSRKESGINILSAESKDIDAVKKIAHDSFIYDRFHSDPSITDKRADRLHANWVADSFFINSDESVLVAKEGGKVLGFLSYSINEGTKGFLGLSVLTIILLAIHPKKRQRGLGDILVRGVLELARQKGIDAVHVGTQLRNIKAACLYQKLGFRLVDTHYTLRKIIKADTRACENVN